MLVLKRNKVTTLTRTMCLFESEVCRERGDMLYNTSVCLSVAVCVYSLHVHLMPWHYRWIPSLNVVLVAFFLLSLLEQLLNINTGTKWLFISSCYHRLTLPSIFIVYLMMDALALGERTTFYIYIYEHFSGVIVFYFRVLSNGWLFGP